MLAAKQSPCFTLPLSAAGGYCTLGATLATQKVGHGVSGDGTQPLMHGPTFMGALDLLEYGKCSKYNYPKTQYVYIYIHV